MITTKRFPSNKFRWLPGSTVVAAILFSSCLKHNLPTYPAEGQAYINEVYFQYRYLDSNQVSNGSFVVGLENLSVTQQIDSATSTITCQVTVPAANGDFDAYQRTQVSLDSLYVYADISTGATVTPVSGAPAFASMASFSSSHQYLVKAANADSARVWTIEVTSFTKP